MTDVLQITGSIRERENGPTVLLIAGRENEATDITRLLPANVSERMTFLTCAVGNWDDMLTPWPDETCMKGRRFGGKAGDTLRNIADKILTGPDCRPRRPVCIAGYSLAGLFALWCLCERPDLFAGAVCCSGSLWYPGWRAYAEEHVLPADKSVYLSLGDREPRTGHPWLKQSGEAMEYQRVLLETADCRSTFVWEQGGHFNEPAARLARGIVWIMENGFIRNER